MLTVFDTEHSEDEDRWATMGIDRDALEIQNQHDIDSITKPAKSIRLLV
jgi:hypothetical protein